MLDLLVIALLQAAAGEPAAPPEQPAATQTVPGNAELQQSQEQNPDDIVRCRRENTTGTRLGTVRVCRTPREEREAREQARQNAREGQDEALRSPSMVPGS